MTIKDSCSSTKIKKKDEKCHFSGNFRHFQNNFLKQKAWFKKVTIMLMYVLNQT